MDFSWTKEQGELYENILQLTQEKLNPPQANADSWWTRAQWQVCAELGLLGLCVPKDYQGKGFDTLTTARAIEAFGQGCKDMGLVFSAAAHLFACVMPIVEHGSTNLKERFLPKSCSGDMIGANAISEQDAGSDVFALKTCATREGESYILTGTKSFVSNGPVADYYIVYATTNPAHGYLGITCFVVERNRPGLLVSETFSKIGLTSTPACQITFNACRIPETNRLGKEGQGALIFKRSMQWERTCLFASYLGQMKRQLEQTITYAQEREQFGKSIGKKQAIAHRLVDMKLRLESARLLLYHACWLFDQGSPSLLDTSLSKLAVSEAALQGGLDAIQIHGSLGVRSEYGIGTMLLDAIPGTIFSGTSEMQRDIIANELGL